jgi:hypothetical protein
MRRRVVVVIVVGSAVLTGCSSASSRTASSQLATTSTSTNTSVTTASTAPVAKDPQVWLCNPGLPSDPCRSSLTTTVVGPDGSRTVQQDSPSADPKIDCFYVYPTVTMQQTVNANLTIDPGEVSVAIAQAARFSQVCRVFAPMYRQESIAGFFSPESAIGAKIAFGDVLSAWRDYLDRYNGGRGVVLIGHSQGSGILRGLIKKYIDPHPSIRARIVSAILLGGDVIVPTGKDVGGDFQHFGACHRASQVGCVIAFSSFDHTPPPNSLFARARKPGDQVLCTNPAALAGGSGSLDTYFPAHRLTVPFSFTVPPLAATRWVRYPDLFTAKCQTVGGASWLQITDIRKSGDNRPKLVEALGPTWGLHIYDGNIALGNLVAIVRSEATAYHPNG